MADEALTTVSIYRLLGQGSGEYFHMLRRGKDAVHPARNYQMKVWAKMLKQSECEHRHEV